MMLQLVEWYEYWDKIEAGVNEINAQHEEYSMAELLMAFRMRMAMPFLDPEHPDEFYIVRPFINQPFDSNVLHVWMAYSKKGGFLKRTVPELEEMSKESYDAEYITFTTVREAWFDKAQDRGIIEGYEKLPINYSKKL